MKLNKQVLQINRNFAISFVAITIIRFIAEFFLRYDQPFLGAAITYVSFFGIFSILFYADNKKRYKQTGSGQIRKELIGTISSFGIGLIVYQIVRWSAMYYFLQIDIHPFDASLISSFIGAAVSMAIISILLIKKKTFQQQ